MANISTAQNGPWSATSTWNGGVVPVAGDNVTLAGHVVTLDQDVTINNLSTSTTGKIELIGSDNRSMTITGVFTPATNSTAVGGIIQFAADYTAPNSTFDIATFTTNSPTTTVTLGTFAATTGATGGVSITIGNYNGDTGSGNPIHCLFYMYNASHMNIDLTVTGTFNLYYGRLFVYQGTGASTANISLTTTSTINGTTGTGFAFASGFVGTITINGTLVRQNLGTFINFASTSSALGSPTVIFNMDLTDDGIYLNGANNCIVVINGDATLSSASAIYGIHDLTINGDLSVTITGYTAWAISFSTTTTPIGSARITGDITVSNRGNGLRTYGSTLYWGVDGGGLTHTMDATGGGAPVEGPIVMYKTAEYEIKRRYYDGTSNYTGPTAILNKIGEGPNVDDVRSGTPYVTGLSGTVGMPSPESVRAGVPVDDTVGVSVVDIADLANLTGSQIAGLSE